MARLDKRFSKRFQDLTEVLSKTKSVILDKAIESVLPIKQKFVEYVRAHDKNLLYAYACKVLGKEIILKLQETNMEFIEGIFNELPTPALSCPLCDSNAWVLRDGKTSCACTSCKLSVLKPFSSVEDWNDFVLKMKA